MGFNSGFKGLKNYNNQIIERSGTRMTQSYIENILCKQENYRLSDQK